MLNEYSLPWYFLWKPYIPYAMFQIKFSETSFAKNLHMNFNMYFDSEPNRGLQF
jgi:hypothetical protein